MPLERGSLSPVSYRLPPGASIDVLRFPALHARSTWTRSPPGPALGAPLDGGRGGAALDPRGRRRAVLAALRVAGADRRRRGRQGGPRRSLRGRGLAALPLPGEGRHRGRLARRMLRSDGRVRRADRAGPGGDRGPGRRLGDALANALGAALGVAAFVLRGRGRRER